LQLSLFLVAATTKFSPKDISFAAQFVTIEVKRFPWQKMRHKDKKPQARAAALAA